MDAIPFLGVAHDSLFMRETSALSDILQTLDLEILPMGVSQHAVIVKLSSLAVTHIGAGHGQGYSANSLYEARVNVSPEMNAPLFHVSGR